MMRQPGHWLLLIPMLEICSILVFFTILASFVDRLFDGEMKSLFVGLAIIDFITVVLFVAASLRNVGVAWRILFLTKAVAVAASCIFYISIAFSFSESDTSYIFFALSNWGCVDTAVAAIGLGLMDWLIGKRRDWLHWTGVLAFVATTVDEAGKAA